MSAISILPDNRTTLETALETTLAKHLERIESPYPTLWNPSGIKAEMLPYLAHAKGVPDWGDDTDSAKRDTVANIWPVQRQAGTRAAVKQAVDALGFDADVRRGESAYQLQVDLWRDDVGTIEPDIIARAKRRIEYVKSERDDIGVTLNASAEGAVLVGLASAVSIQALAGTEGESETGADIGVALGAAVLIEARSCIAVEHLVTEGALSVALMSDAQIIGISAVEAVPPDSDIGLCVALVSDSQIIHTITECY